MIRIKYNLMQRFTNICALLMLSGISLAHVGAEFGKFREVDADVAAEQRVKIVKAGGGGGGGDGGDDDR